MVPEKGCYELFSRIKVMESCSHSLKAEWLGLRIARRDWGILL